MKTLQLVAAFAILLMACNRDKDGSDAYGNFEAKEIIIAAEANGKVLSLEAEEGCELKAGQIAGLIDTTQLSLTCKQLVAKKEAVASNLNSIQAQIAVQEEQKNNLMKEKQRLENLIKDDAATTKQMDDITYNINVLVKQIYSVQTQKEAVYAEMRVLENQLKALEDQLSKCKIINPVNGTVLEKYVEAYEIVNMGRSIYKIADLSEMDLRVYISGSQLPHVKIGQQVNVLIDEDEDENKGLPGVVTWISSKAEFTPKIIQTKEERVNMVYAMKIRVKNDGGIKIGMPGEVKFNDGL